MSQTLRNPEMKLLDGLMAPRPEVVVASGGPAGGKSTGLDFIKHGGVETNRPIIALPEYPSLWMDRTGLNLGELAGNDREAYIEAQKTITQMSLDGIATAMRKLAGTNGVVLADRGAADPGAYMTEEESIIVAESLGHTRSALRHNFADKVVFLRSLGVSYPEIYTAVKGSNEHRYEDRPEQAAATDEMLLQQWQRHPELHIIDTDDEMGKYAQLGRYALELDAEYERKWRIGIFAAKEYMNGSQGKLINLQSIEQGYFENDGVVFRVRSATVLEDSHREYSFSVKKSNSELRRRITEVQAEQLVATSAQLGSIKKTRFTYYDDKRVWHLDEIEAEDQPIMILETEASSHDELAEITPLIHGVDTDFSNEKHALSR